MAIKSIKILACILFFSSTIGTFQSISLKDSRNSVVDALANNQQLSDKKYQLDLLKRMPSLGFRNLVSNWNFIQFLQYFGDEKNRKITGYSLSPDYLSLSLKYDPYYKDFYLFLSESTTFYAGMPDKTVDLMQQGLSSFKEQKPADSYYIWRYKGIDELLFLNDGQSAQKSFEKAAKWAIESDDENSQLMASLSQQTATLLASDPKSTQAQISAWSSILTTTLDNATQIRAIRQIRELGGDVVLGSDGQLQIKYAKAEDLDGRRKPDS
jgi:hypothetical protein